MALVARMSPTDARRLDTPVLGTAQSPPRTALDEEAPVRQRTLFKEKTTKKGYRDRKELQASRSWTKRAGSSERAKEYLDIEAKQEMAVEVLPPSEPQVEEQPPQTLPPTQGPTAQTEEQPHMDQDATEPIATPKQDSGNTPELQTLPQDLQNTPAPIQRSDSSSPPSKLQRGWSSLFARSTSTKSNKMARAGSWFSRTSSTTSVGVTTEDKGQKLSRSGSSLLVGAREPPLYMSPYDQPSEPGTAAGMDPFVLWHNAIRRELIDLYFVVNFYGKAAESKTAVKTDVTHEEVIKWLNEYRAFVGLYFKVERELLFDWGLKNARSAAQKEAESRIVLEKLEDLRGKWMRIDALIDKYLRLKQHNQEQWDGLMLVLDETALRLVKYFRAEEAVLPKLLGDHGSRHEVTFIERKMCKFVLKHPKPKLNMLTLLRWIPEESRKDEWVRLHFSPLDAARVRRWLRTAEQQKHRRTIRRLIDATAQEKQASQTLTPAVMADRHETQETNFTSTPVVQETAGPQVSVGVDDTRGSG